MLIRHLFLLSALFFSLQLQAQGEPGFRQVTLSKLNISVWYPTASQGATESVGENPAFYGVSVIRDAPPLAGEHPLLVISHGYNGNWRNLSWIAAAMAAQGYIVAAVDHPGTTTFNQDVVAAKELWRRPQDLSQVIDVVINAAKLFGKTDPQRIAGLGHSLGGWTIMSLAGARFEPTQVIQDCQHYPERGDCKLIAKLGIDNPLLQAKLAANYRDPRVKAVVSVDLGFAPGFTPQSLNDIQLPVLILAAQMDKLAALSAEQESGYLAANLPQAWRQYHIVEGATHFSFMQRCKPGAEALINEASPSDDIVCQDAPGAKRSDIHQKLVETISLFLNASLDYHPPVDEIKSENRQ